MMCISAAFAVLVWLHVPLCEALFSQARTARNVQARHKLLWVLCRYLSVGTA